MRHIWKEKSTNNEGRASTDDTNIDTLSRELELNQHQPMPSNIFQRPLTIYHHPFKAFPAIQSHVHPFFVIFDIGRKLAQQKRATPDLQVLHGSHPYCWTFQSCLALYTKWTTFKAPSSSSLGVLEERSSSSSCQSGASSSNNGSTSVGENQQYNLRSNASSGQGPLNSHHSRGDPHEVAASRYSHSLPTPEASHNYDQLLGKTLSALEPDHNCAMGVRTSIEGWVENVKLSVPFSDPDITSHQSAEPALRVYRLEEASTV
jgi:hypothetical protein